MIVFLKESFEKVTFEEKNSRQHQKHEKILDMAWLIWPHHENLPCLPLHSAYILSLLDKFKVTSEHVLIIGHCPLM